MYDFLGFKFNFLINTLKKFRKLTSRKGHQNKGDHLNTGKISIITNSLVFVKPRN